VFESMRYVTFFFFSLSGSILLLANSLQKLSKH